jgi:hypothetical protein
MCTTLTVTGSTILVKTLWRLADPNTERYTCPEILFLLLVVLNLKIVPDVKKDFLLKSFIKRLKIPTEHSLDVELVATFLINRGLGSIKNPFSLTFLRETSLP